MNWIFFICLVILCSPYAHCQNVRQTHTYYSFPSWDTALTAAVKNQLVMRDSVYFYAKMKNNHDSVLAVVHYFDTSGNLVERDEFNSSTHKVVRIINYRYTDNLLMMEETVTKSSVPVTDDGGGMLRTIHTFDRDTTGNIITDKKYYFNGDSLKPSSVFTNSREYDSTGHLCKEYTTLPNGKLYLYHSFEYINGILSEEKTYDTQQQWTYSHQYEYDERKKTKSVYLVNESRNIRDEYFYDSQKRIIKLKNYSNRNLYWDYSTNEYTYSSNGLLESQVFHAANGDSFMYRHFYTKKTQ